jgi:hypothetical protein
MATRRAMTKKEQLTEQLALETAIRLGLVACFINLVAQHARVIGGDNPSKALGEIQSAMRHTVSSLKVNAKDAGGGSPDISDFVQRNVNKMLDQAFLDAQKQLSRPVH